MTAHTRPLVVGIAGCSGSGKTTLALELARQLDATLLPLDLYYRDLGHLTPGERALHNFDHPDSIEQALLAGHVRALAAGMAVHAPRYDFATHTRIAGRTIHFVPRDVVLIEGILALHYDELRALYDCSVFVEAPEQVCLARRIHRDVAQRGRTEQCVREQFWTTAQPMAERYVLPSAAHATLRVAGTDALDWSVEQVLAMLRGVR